jgi:DNA ligase D-like protein (predicted 3'-phosphoesterase)
MAVRKKTGSSRRRALDTPARSGNEKRASRSSHDAAAAAALSEYVRKRDFEKTPEPSGASAKRRKKADPIFVIQKHDATRLHYDFRLEIDGVLKSWAIPKGPSTNPGDKRLAVETEDHPMDYADFEGIIPEAEYGGGTVIVWDTGTFRNLKRDARGNEVALSKCYANGQIEVWLEGSKLRGGYALIHAGMGGAKKNWLCIKMKDEGADVGRDVVTDEPESALSGRTLEDVAARKPAGRPRRRRTNTGRRRAGNRTDPVD